MLFTILAIFLLILALIQDVRSYAISTLLFPILFMVLGAMAWQQVAVPKLLRYTLMNLTITGINIAGIFLYIRLVKKVKKGLMGFFGLGDILFLLCITLVFSPGNYIIFTMGSSLTILLAVAILRLFQKKNIQKVPLAGLQAGFLIAVLIADEILAGVNRYNDLLFPDIL